MTQQRGFSLIEMLVALVIMSLSLGVLYQAAMGATRNVRVASEYSEALTLAESTLSELLVAPMPDTAVTGSWGEFRWQGSVQPVTLEAADPEVQPGRPLAEVRVTVSWGEGRGPRQVTLSTIAPAIIER